MDLLIDGYNLIFQCGLQGRRADSLALEAARNRLISVLSSQMNEAARARTTIVFDASDRPVKEVVDDHRINAMRVMFAVKHEEADALIEELIRKHSNPKNLTVVSSDHRIQKAALRRKATPIDSDIWFDWLENQLSEPSNEGVVGQADSGHSDEKPIPPGLKDVDWEQEFGLNDDSDPLVQRSPKSNPPNPFPPGYGEDLL